MIVVREVPFLNIVRCVFIHIKLRALEPKQSPRRERALHESRKQCELIELKIKRNMARLLLLQVRAPLNLNMLQGSERMKSIVLYIHDGDYGVTSERDVDDEEFRIRVEGTLSKAVFFFFSLLLRKD